MTAHPVRLGNQLYCSNHRGIGLWAAKVAALHSSGDLPLSDVPEKHLSQDIICWKAESMSGEDDHYLKKELYALSKQDSSIFEFLQRYSLDGLWYWDLEAPENEWLSPEFWELLGYDPAEKRHLASEWQNLIHPEDLQNALRNFEAHCKDPNHPYDQVVRYCHKDGSTVWVRCRGVAIRDRSGSPVRLLGAHNDLTQVKAAEDALRQSQVQLEQRVKERTAELTETNERLRAEIAERKRAKVALGASEERFRFMIENASDVIAIVDTDGIIRYESPSVEGMLGYKPEEFIGKTALHYVHSDDVPTLRAVFKRLLANPGRVERNVYRHKHKDGSWRVLESIRKSTVEDGIVTGVVGNARDITERKQVEEVLASERERFKDFAEVAADYFWEMGPDLRLSYVSEGFEEIIGLPPNRVLGRTRREFCSEHIGDTEKWAQHFRDLEAHRDFEEVELPWVRLDNQARVLRISGKPVFDSGGVFRGYRGVGRDVTDAHHMAQQIAYQATHDVLTELVNRQEFEHRLRRVLETARTEQAEHALCYLDLDQFKVINDTCGHVAGDELLRQLGGLLQQKVRKRDTLARLGGDEFGVLMEHCSLNQALRVANSLREAVEEYRFAWEDKRFNIGVSMGLVPITESSESIIRVLGAADTACYAAKDEGRNRIHVYREDDAELAKRHGEMQWVARIQRALEEQRFHLNFQPISPVNSSRQEGTHYELLLRMQDEEGHTVLPGAFLPAAERYNLATKLDGWVVRTAFEWLGKNPKHLEQLYLCEINLSGQSLGDSEFLELVVRQLRESAIPPEKVCFEVTETAAITNLTSATHFIQTLKGVGCQFALDDFGSGLSSFAYLKTLPADFLKIDGLFVKDIADDPTDLAMVKSINEIGHTMGKRTVAESVENAAILQKLKERGIGVDYAQGYHIGRPKPIAELA